MGNDAGEQPHHARERRDPVGIGGFRFKVVLNQFRKNTDPSLAEKIKIVCNRHFYSPFDILGSVEFDERVVDSISVKKLFVRQHPETAAANQLKQIAARVLYPNDA